MTSGNFSTNAVQRGARTSPWLVAVVVAALTGGCASAPLPAPAQPATQGPLRATPQVISANEAGTPAELFERGKRAFLAEKYAEAGSLFDLVQKGDPSGPLAPMAALQAGLAYEQSGDRAEALTRYLVVPQQYPKEPLVKLALLHAGRVLVALERWEALAKNADALGARADLSVSEQIEAEGERALSLVETGQVEKAQRVVNQARGLMEQHHIGEAGRPPPEATQIYFALGEIRRAQSEAIRFDPPPANFGDTFERRAAGLLDAQSAYTDAMRSADPAWATMAGYRVGKLYQQLHHDVISFKAPPTIKNARERLLFEGAMHLRYRVLLKKGLSMIDATVRLTERTGDEGAWAARAKEAKADLQSALTDEEAYIKKLPVSEAELQKRLDELQAKRAGSL